jgi:hypothetical protein
MHVGSVARLFLELTWHVLHASEGRSKGYANAAVASDFKQDTVRWSGAAETRPAEMRLTVLLSF